MNTLLEPPSFFLHPASVLRLVATLESPTRFPNLLGTGNTPVASHACARHSLTPMFREAE